MTCPKCEADTQVVDSRYSVELKHTRRRRECLNCGARFSTYETILVPNNHDRALAAIKNIIDNGSFEEPKEL
ncbi:MAG: transcriptional regulator [Mu-like cryoconite phage AB09]|nr:MAG: transcriptional regulator [Mu-like cryoconite phage AB09]